MRTVNVPRQGAVRNQRHGPLTQRQFGDASPKKGSMYEAIGCDLLFQRTRDDRNARGCGPTGPLSAASAKCRSFAVMDAPLCDRRDPAA
jgi:hypothetical protein